MALSEARNNVVGDIEEEDADGEEISEDDSSKAPLESESSSAFDRDD